MKLTAVLRAVILAGVVATVEAVPSDVSLDPFTLFGADLARSNHYGAPEAPWEGGRPAWYFGKYPGKVPNLPSLSGPICQVLKLFPRFLQCPTPPPPNPQPEDGWTKTFSNATASTQGDGDYLTFGLVDTVPDCKAMCNAIPECIFANTYRDVNGKDGSPLLTCALYTKCHGLETALNTGGQTQPDGSTNFIINSDGWCKS